MRASDSPTWAGTLPGEMEKPDGAPPRPLYSSDLSLMTKIETVAREVYGAEGVYLEAEARKKIQRFEKAGFANLPVCKAKTQSSFTDNPKLYGAPTG